MGFDTASLLATLQKATETSQQVLSEGAKALQTNTAEAQRLFTQGQQELTQAVTDSAKVAADRAQTEYAGKKLVEQLQSTFNLDPTQVNNEIAVSLNEANAASEAYKPARAEYDRLNQVGFFDNPLGFIMAQVKLPQVAAQVNALADQEDRALQNIQNKTSLLESSKRAVVANTADAVLAQNQEQARIDAKVANAKLTQASAENQARLGASIMQQIQIADKVNDNTRSAVQAYASIQAAEEARGARADARQDREVDRALRREQIQTILDEKKAKAEEVAAMNDRLAAVSASLGLATPMTIEGIKRIRDKGEAEKWLDAAYTGKYGKDLASAVEFYSRKVSPENVTGGGASSVLNSAKRMNEAAAKYIAPIQNAHKAATGKPMKDEEATSAAFQQYLKSTLEAAVNDGSPTDMSSSTWDTTYNPGMAPIAAFSRAIDSSPQLAALKGNLVKQQYETMLAAKVVSGDTVAGAQQSQIIDSLKWKVVNKEITAQKAAADISTFFKAANEYNVDMNKQDLFGVPKLDKYNFSIKDGGKADLFDPVKVEAAIQRAARTEFIRSQGGIQTPFGATLGPAFYDR